MSRFTVTKEEVQACALEDSPIKSQLCASWGEGSAKEIELRISNPFGNDIKATLCVIDHQKVVGEFPATQLQEAVDLFNTLP